MRVLFATLALLLTANGYGATDDTLGTQALAQQPTQSVAGKEAASKKLEAEAQDRKAALDKAWDKFLAAQKGPMGTNEERARTHQEVADAQAEIEKAGRAYSKAYEAAKSAREEAEKVTREANATREAAAKAVATPPGQPGTSATAPVAQLPAGQQPAVPPEAPTQPLSKADGTTKHPSTSRLTEIAGPILAVCLIALLVLWVLWKFACIIVLILAAFCNAFGIKRWPGLLDLADQISAERQKAREARANKSSGFSKTSIYSMAGLGWYELRMQREAMEKQAEELRQQTRLMEERNQELRRKH